MPALSCVPPMSDSLNGDEASDWNSTIPSPSLRADQVAPPSVETANPPSLAL